MAGGRPKAERETFSELEVYASVGTSVDLATIRKDLVATWSRKNA